MAKIRLFNRYWYLPAAVCLAVETGLLVFAVWAGYEVRAWVYYGRVADLTLPYFHGHFPVRAGVFAAIVLLTLYFNDLYDFGERLSRRQLWIRLARALLIAAVILLVLYYLTYPVLTIGRGAFAVALPLSGMLLLAWRKLLGWFLARVHFGGRLLIVGGDRAARELAREVLAREHLGYRILGFLDDDPALQGMKLVNPRVIGTTSQAWELGRAHKASRIVVARTDKRGMLNMDDLLRCKNFGIPVEEGSNFYERLTGKISLEGLRKSWLIFSRGFVVSPLTRAIKRLTDLVAASVMLAAAAPLMLLVALAIRIDSRGPILYRQERIGFRGRPFTLLKFRSMQVGAERPGEARWAEPGDPRVTRVGRALRKTRLDELPQLWNVLLGDMSLVGPRPERQEFVQRLRQISPFYDQRHAVRPGLTGWAQIMAAYAASVDESIEKLQFDLFYIKNLSFFLDLSILASTAKILLLGKGSR